MPDCELKQKVQVCKSWVWIQNEYTSESDKNKSFNQLFAYRHELKTNERKS